MLKCVLRIFCLVSFEEMLSARLVNWTPFYINTSKSSSSLLGDVFFLDQKVNPKLKDMRAYYSFQKKLLGTKFTNNYSGLAVRNFSVQTICKMFPYSNFQNLAMWTICKRVMRKFNCSWLLLRDVPHICHFFTRAKVLENKIYTEKRQILPIFANFLR